MAFLLVPYSKSILCPWHIKETIEPVCAFEMTYADQYARQFKENPTAGFQKQGHFSMNLPS